MFAEEVDGRHCNQYKEVQSHQQVICNNCLRAQLTGCTEGVCHSSKVYRAADIGAGEHSCNLVQVRNEFVQSKEAAQSAQNGTDRADQIDNQQLAAFFTDLFDVALEQQKRNCQWNDIRPNTVIVFIKRHSKRNNSEACVCDDARA